MSRRALLLSAAAGLGCGHRKATAVHGFCFVANRGGSSVTVIDLSHFRVRKEIRLDTAPGAVIAHPSQPKVFVLAPETGALLEIDAVKLEVTRRLRVANAAIEMRLSPAGDALWVLTRDPSGLAQVALDSLRVGTRIALPAAETFDLGEAGLGAVACGQERSIMLAPLSGGGARRIAYADEPSIVAFRKDGRQVLAGSRSARTLAIFDVVTGKMVVRLPLPVEPRHFSVNSDGGQVFISGQGMDAVVVVYPYETEVGETFLAGHAPGPMAVTDTPEYLMVTNPEAGTVTVLDFENNGKLVAAVQVGQEPRHIVLTPPRAEQDQYALVLNEKSGDVAVIRIATLANSDPLRRYQPRPLFALIPAGERPVSAAIVTFG